MLYQVSAASKSYGASTIFENVQFEIKGTEKIAVVGRNGCGKTTFLRCLAKEENFDAGYVSVANDVSIGYLAQKALSDDERTVEEELRLIYAPIFQLEEELHQYEKLMEDDYSEQLLQKYAQLQSKYEAMRGYHWESEMRTVFTKFGFQIADLQKKIGEFSGGQKTKIAFVRLLLSKPDILLLDEPTNHLDLETIEWLEGYIKNYPKSAVIVSHDRMFLDHVVTVVYDMEFGSMKRYAGNYSAYVELKKNDVERQNQAYVRQQKEIERLQALIEKFRYKPSKASFAQSKIKYLERMDKVEKAVTNKKNFHASFTPRIKGGEKVLEVEDLTIGYDKPLSTVSFKLMRKDRLAIIGPNGTGKSTLVKTLMNHVKKLGGSYMYGHQIETGYFDQQLAQFSGGKTVLEEVWDENPDMDRTQVRTLLGRFLFSADDVFKTVDVLSGGEKVRLSLAKLMLEEANLLILDEPTNHLDIPGKEALEEALKEYTGTILFVSHDRYFIDRIANKLLILTPENAQYINMSYSDYIASSQQTNAPLQETTQITKKSTYEKPQSPEAIRKEISRIERQITEKENTLEDLRQLRFEPEYYQDSQKMNELDQEIDDVHNELNHLYEKWEEFSEM